MKKGSELLRLLDLRFRDESENGKKPKTVTKVAALNRAKNIMWTYLAPKIDLNVTLSVWLSPLKRFGEKPIKLVKKGKNFNRYQLPEDFGRIRTIKIEAVKEKKVGDKVITCKADIDVKPFPSKSILPASLSHYNSASFDFEEAYRELGDENTVLLYHDSDFGISKAYLNYLAKHPDIHGPSVVKPDRSYVYYDGQKITKDSPWLMGGESHEVLLDVAEIHLRDNQADLVTALQRILNERKILL